LKEEENMKKPRCGVKNEARYAMSSIGDEVMAMRCSVSVVEVRRLVAEQGWGREKG
jgi:hypothetical protein